MNVASGLNALGNNSSGSNNIALGASAGLNLTTGSNNIHIGAPGVAGESGKIRIGKQGAQSATYIAGISGKTVGSTSAAPVYVDNTGHLGTIKSSARFKQQIKPMDTASEAILKLDPVTFRYKEGLDPDGVVQFGLIAEQVEKIDARLVIRDEDGKVSTVRYEAVNAMLLNEFLKEHRKVEQLSASDADQKRESAQQQKQIEGLIASVKAQAAQIQKVSAQVHLDKSAPHLVAEKE